jgi:GDP-L-fucose synthase
MIQRTNKIIWDSTKPDGTPRILMDVSKMKESGWKANIGLEEGIRETYAWFLENVEAVKEMKL